MPPELTPREGARIPPKHEQLPAHEKALMEEIDKMAKDEAQAMTVLAQSSLRTADACEDVADLLEDLKALVIKLCQHTGMPLPKRIADAITSGEYSPDEDDLGEEESDDASGVA